MARDHGQDADRDVDREHRLPAVVLGEVTAEQWPRRESRRLRRGLDAECFASLLGRHRGRDQRDAVGLQHRRAHRLGDAGSDERVETGRVHTRDGRAGEDREAVDVDDLAAQPVRDPAHWDEQRHERDQVAERDPLGIRAEVLTHRGERERDDRGVQLPHERPEADRRDHQPRRIRPARYPRRPGGLRDEPVHRTQIISDPELLPEVQ